MARSASASRLRPPRTKAPAAAMPTWVEPMKAVLGEGLPPQPENYAFEFKWDGVRILAFCDGGHTTLMSRNGLNATPRYPELADLAAGLKAKRVILDGELIAVDEKGNPSFPLLQTRMNVTRADAIARGARDVPIFFCVFDILWLDGRNLCPLPWTDRRKLLEKVLAKAPQHCRLSPVTIGEGKAMLAVAQEKGLEGLMAKRLDSEYLPGDRSSDWLKVKLVGRQELVVGGWVPEVGKDGRIRTSDIGAILLGYYEGKEFRFAGAVGTGFTREASAAMVKKLTPLATDENPFTDGAIRKFRAAVQFVKPRVVVEVEFRRWPEGALMHQAAFKGIRNDKPAKDVVREKAQAWNLA